MNRWRAGLAELGRSLFLLAPGERQALCVILALAMLGLGVKTWRACHGESARHDSLAAPGRTR